MTKSAKESDFLIFFNKKFAGLNFIHTFAVPKTKQPLTMGEKKRDVATKFN